MPRPIEVRPSYDNDAGFLTRLSVAISKDTAQPNEWIREAQTTIQSLILLLTEANKRKINR